MTIGSWNGHTFEVSPTLIRGFTDLNIKGSCETEDQSASKQKYVARKNAQSAELTLTVSLNALTGVTDVRGEAMTFVAEARAGASDYFYIGSAKLLPAKLMLTAASVENVSMARTTWISCDVKLTMKQAEKDGTLAGSADKSSKKKSSKRKGTSGKGAGANQGVDAANQIVNAAKAASKALKLGIIKTGVSIDKAKRAAARKNTAKKVNVTTGRTIFNSGGKKVLTQR